MSNIPCAPDPHGSSLLMRQNVIDISSGKYQLCPGGVSPVSNTVYTGHYPAVPGDPGIPPPAYKAIYVVPEPVSAPEQPVVVVPGDTTTHAATIQQTVSGIDPKIIIALILVLLFGYMLSRK